MLLQKTNTPNNLYQDVGGTPVETGIKLPTPAGRANWIYYDVALGCQLDSGIAVHRVLPQVDTDWDTLGSCNIFAKDIDKLTGRGVNLISKDNYQDLVQRMAHSQYWFRLWGQAMRVGEQVPIPRLLEVAKVEAVPYDVNRQWAYNKIVGNYSGQVLWYAQWSLWYTLASAPKAQQDPPQNLAQHINAESAGPIQAPWSLPNLEAPDV